MTAQEEALARAKYRIISDPSWQLQLLREGEWVTVVYCGSEESAKRAIETRIDRMRRGRNTLANILR